MMSQWWDQAIAWIKTWDFMAIFYSFVASIVFAIILKWSGGFRWLYRQYKLRKGINSYRKSITDVCSSLIVIGRRHGFSIYDVFEPLDLAPSDLMAQSKDATSSPQGSYVLIGGPGAGKSTMAKNMILEHLKIPMHSTPFLIRLREYDSSKSIEDFLIDQMSAHRVPDPELFVRNQLNGFHELCILDGLDEVRPNVRERVYENINQFYKRFFLNEKSNALVITCRKEAYRSIPLDLPSIWEVRPLTDEQIQRLAKKWPLGYPTGKSADTFWRDLVSSPRILELARSPLLLVGGLMQYTESNLGIPEERVEYLSRIGKWLVTDWATAQGHPPDPYRSVYSRVLSKLAFEMQKSQRPECSADEACALLEIWLPSYGYKKEEAKNVLDNIMTRTGILVHDTPATVVFAQFGLQEYFASIDAIDNLGIKTFASLSPKNWWREVILLAIAQEKEPESCLKELFLQDPLLAVAAIAECPTPAISLQEMAMSECIKGIDNNDEAAKSSAVALLRKVKGQQEEKLISQLENRLSGSSQISSAVGMILATADTAVATSALERHPAIWDSCLEAAGFLSSSFENLLVGWIKHGDDQQSKHAADLLAPRLSSDRCEELLDLLPTLPSTRAEHVATLLLKFIEADRQKGFFPQYDENLLRKVSRCIPHITNIERYFKERRQPIDRHGINDSLIPVSLFLHSQNKSLSAIQIFEKLIKSIMWAKYRGVILCFIASGLALTSFFFDGSQKSFLMSSLFIYFLGIGFPYGSPPWELRFNYYYYPKTPIAMIILASGALFVLSLGHLEFSANALVIYYIYLSSAYLLTGFMLRSMSLPRFFFEIKLPKLTKYLPGAWLLILSLSGILFFTFPKACGLWLGVLAALFSLCFIVIAVFLYFQWKSVRIAANKMESSLSRMERSNA